MRRIIKRGSKTSLFLFIGSIFIILSGVIVTINESIGNFSIVLLGFGSLFFTLSVSEVENKRSEMLSYGRDVFTSIACFWASYFMFFIAGKIMTAKLFALAGILILGFAFFTFFIRRRTSA